MVGTSYLNLFFFGKFSLKFTKINLLLIFGLLLLIMDYLYLFIAKNKNDFRLFSFEIFKFSSLFFLCLEGIRTK